MSLGTLTYGLGSIAGGSTSLVRWLDHRGNVVASREVGTGATVSAPSAPTFTGLTFHSWCGSSSLVTEDRDIIAVYLPTDGKRTLLVEASALVGLTPTLKVTKSDTSELTVDWGDGTTSTSSASGSVTIVKDAAYVAGSYQIRMWISTGTGTFSGGHGTTGNPMLAGVAVTEYWANADVTAVSAYAFNGTAFRTMEAMTGFVACLSVGDYAFQNAYALETAAFPVVTSFGPYALSSSGIVSACAPEVLTLGPFVMFTCYRLLSVYIPKANSIGDSGLQNCYNLNKLVAPALSSLGASCLRGNFSLDTISLPGLTTVGDSVFRGASSVAEVNLPSLATGASSAMNSMFLLRSVVLPSIATVSPDFFRLSRNIESITIGPNCTSVESLALDGVSNLRTLRVEAATPPTLFSVASLADFDPRLVIEVPAASLAAYQSATNWSSFADRMVGY